MTPEIVYFFKVNLALVLFYAFYRLFFYKDTFFRLRRSILLAFFAIAFLYPLLDIQEWIQEQKPMVEVATLYSSMLPQVVADASVQAADGEELFMRFFTYIYIAVVVGLCIRFMVQFGSILLLASHCKKVLLKGTKVYLLQAPSGPFSFFNMIFISPDVHTEKELDEILAHEKTHASQYHSVDVIMGELISILCWINPFVWLLKREVRHNLEYLADNMVITSGYDSKSYQYHLLGLAHHQGMTNLYNSFNMLHLKNRIRMMNKKRSKGISRTKYLMFLPLAAILMFMSNIDAIARITHDFADKEFKLSGQTVDKYQHPVSEGDLTINAPVTGLISDKQRNLTIPDLSNTTSLPSHTEYKAEKIEVKELEKVLFKKNKSPIKVEKERKLDISSNDIFTIVEDMPEYPGGQSALMRYINTHLQYPVTAMENGIQGRVICSFVVNEEGNVEGATIVRGVDPTLDSEAIRVVSTIQQWKPGKQRGQAVKVKFTIPVLFRLGPEPARNTHNLAFLEKKASLYIVDGKEMSYQDIIRHYNSSMLLDITVEKGQSVIREYGERAKNGVMKITTKQISI